MTDTKQATFDALVFHPVIVPTPDVDHGAEYQEGDPVYWNGEAWGVLDWDFDHNAFVLLNDVEWDTFASIHADGRWDVREEIVSALWEAE
jgi:hypothetical protein